MISRNSASSDFFYLLFIALVANIIIIANPGFYSHDEWTKFDHIEKRGLLEYMVWSVSVSGSHLGVPIRPVGYIHQGLASLFMENYPYITHTIDVLIHFFCAWILYRIILFYADRLLAFLAASLFLMSPATTMAVGWMAASMDRLYVLFIGLTILTVVGGLFASSKAEIKNKDQYLSYLGNTKYRLALTFLFSLAAIFSKEAAIITPVAIILVVFSFKAEHSFFQTLLKSSSFIIISSLAIVFYFLLRIDDIINTITTDSPGQYNIGISNILDNALIYFGYIFNPIATEAHALLDYKAHWQMFGIGVHIVLLLLLGLVRPTLVLVYLAGFFLPLAPVLPIPIAYGHYLYGSAVAVSIAVAYLLLRATGWLGQLRKPRGTVVQTAIVGLMIGLLAVHHFRTQIGFYSNGVCQAQMYRSLEDVHALVPEARTFVIQNEARKSLHVLLRLTGPRRRIGDNHDFRFVVNPDEGSMPTERDGSPPLELVMLENCTILPAN